MIYDPNSTIAQSHEARVRARGVRLSPNSSATSQVSTRSDFIAPDYASPSTHEIEMEKGRAGWSAGPKPVDQRPAWIARAERRIKAQREAQIEEITITGTAMIRKAPPAPMVKLNRTGPRRNRKGHK